MAPEANQPGEASRGAGTRSDAVGTGGPARRRAIDRRQFLTVAKGVGGVAAMGALAGCSGGDGGDGGGDGGDGGGTPTSTPSDGGTATPSDGGTSTPAQELTSMHHVVPEGSFYVVPFLYGVENDAWSQFGIDLNVEVGPFPKFQRQIVADLANVGGMPMVSAIDFNNQGEDLTWLGPGMTFANFMLAPADSDIQTPEDIEGKILGVPFETSTTTLGYRALMQDAFGMDLMAAPSEVRAAAPPVVWNLLNQGEIDVALEFSGFSIRGQISEDIRVVFNPIEYWRNEYGSVVPLTQRTAKRSWLQESPENADLARRFGQGWAASLEIFRNNIDDAIARYGRLGGLTSQEMGDVVIDRMEREVQFSTPPYTEDQADSNWQFAQSLVDAGVYDSLPERDAMITLTSELEELASG